MQALERHPWLFLAVAVLFCAFALFGGHRAALQTKRDSIARVAGR